MINHVVLMRIIKFNLKQAKQKSLKVCIMWEAAGFLEF